MNKGVENICYDEFHWLTINLIPKLPNTIDCVVGLSRGGLLPGVILSHQLNVKFLPLVFSLRDFIEDSVSQQFLDQLQRYKHILIVDDINDTGETFTALTSYLKQRLAIKYTTAALLQRHASNFSVDFFSKLIDNDDWINFPYEKQ